MIKMMVLIKAKPGISLAAFREYYESKHVPLIRRLHPTIAEYRRNYIDPNRTELPPGREWPDFDVVTEARFHSWDDFARFRAVSADPAVRQQVLAEEDHFVDTAKTRRLIVEECPERAIDPDPGASSAVAQG
jgi:uncharacterized protein (TIGR02118 family)